MRRHRVLISAIAVTALFAAACTSSDSSSGDSDAPELTGDPIKLMVLTDGGDGGIAAVDRVPAAAQVAADAVNADGGVQGSPIEIVACGVGAGDPNLAAACARDAVSDGLTGLVGAFTTAGDSYVPVLEEAGIPTVAPFAISFAEFSSELSYPIMGGAPSTTAGLGAQVADDGATRINVTFLDIAQGALAATLVQEGLTPRGLEVADETPLPPDTPDLASTISAAEAGDPDAILIVAGESDAARYLRQASELGVEATLAVSSAATNPAEVETLGSAGDGVLVTSNFVPTSQTDNSGVKQFLDERAEYDPDLDIDDSGINAWAGVHVIAEVLADATGDITAPATLIEALDAASGIDLGLLPPISFDQEPEPLFGGAITRLFNRDVFYAIMESGEIVPQADDTGFIDPFVAPGDQAG